MWTAGRHSRSLSFGFTLHSARGPPRPVSGINEMGLPSRPDSDIIRQLAAWRRPLTRAPEGDAWYAFEPGEPPRCPAVDERRSSPRDANGRRSSARPCNRALHFANANTITLVRVQ